MDKRYQVFVSSTFADLQAERLAVIQTLLSMDCIPAGMELFPAMDQEQFDFIKRVIDDCDYYLLIIGNRYGSMTAEGVSYTEKEYEYALERGLKVIAFVHNRPDDVSVRNSDIDAKARTKLQAFRDRVAIGRLVKHWNQAAELPGLVALSVTSAIRLYPAIGWIRANKAASEDLLGEVNELRKENQELRGKIASEATFAVENLAGLDEPFELKGRLSYQGSYQNWKQSLTWSQIFGAIAPYLFEPAYESTVSSTLGRFAFGVGSRSGRYDSLDSQDFHTVKMQLLALGLVRVDQLNTVNGGVGVFWKLTQRGTALGLELRTIKANANSQRNSSPRSAR